MNKIKFFKQWLKLFIILAIVFFIFLAAAFIIYQIFIWAPFTWIILGLLVIFYLSGYDAYKITNNKDGV